MKRFILLAIFFSLTVFSVKPDEINFPPELMWWIYEVKKGNPDIEINKFTLFDKSTIKFNTWYQIELTYPVFMRWNYYGNTVAYYDYSRTKLVRQNSGKYYIGNFDDVASLLFADKNRKVFWGTDFGVSEGLNSICWLTDTVLIGVGLNVSHSRGDYDAEIDLRIYVFKIDYANKVVEETLYVYENAFLNSVRLRLKLPWYKQRPDYFEFRE